MMVINPIDQGAYDQQATLITYCKLFPFIVNDFLTREDCKELVKASNLIVSVTAYGNATVAGPTGSMSGMATVPVNTNVKVIYDGTIQTPGTTSLGQQIKAKKISGNSATTALTSTISGAMG